jgi:O-antigen ligase
MLKAILYLGLAGFAIIGTFFSPIIGAIGAIEAYLFNPVVFGLSDGGFRYQLWVTIAFLLSCLIHRVRGVERVGREGLVVKALWAFVAIGALSAAWAVVSPQLALDTIYEVLKTVLLVTFLVLAIRSEKDMSILLFACLIGVLHASFMHVVGPRIGYVPMSLAREYGVLPEYQTVVLVLFIPLLVLLAMMGQRNERVLAWVTLPLALDSIVNSYMRTGFVALAVELVAIFLFLPRRLTFKLLPVLGAGGALFFFVFTPTNYWDWMNTIKHPTEEGSANSRFEIDAVSLQMFLDHPMGVGYRNYIEISPQYFRPEQLDPGTGKRAGHNAFLTVLCETGVFGFAAWTSAFGGAVWLLRGIRKRADANNLTRIEIYAIGLEIGLYGWLVSGLFHSTHEVDPAFWFAGFAVTLTRLHRQAGIAEHPAADGHLETVADGSN